MDASDVVGIIEGALISTTWVFVSRRSSDFQGWRRKLEVLALVCPTVAVALDLVVKVSDHFPDSFAANLLGYSEIGTFLMGFCGLTLSIFGRGSFRFTAIVWSLWALAVSYFAVAAGLA